MDLTVSFAPFLFFIGVKLNIRVPWYLNFDFFLLILALNEALD